MNLNQILTADMNNLFDSTTISRGRSYFNSGRVEKLSLRYSSDPIEANIKATVRGSRVYKVDIDVLEYGEGGAEVLSDCSCPIGYGCKHVVAALFEAMHSNTPAPKIQPSFDDAKSLEWIKLLDEGVKSALKTPEFDPGYELHFIFDNSLLSVMHSCVIQPVLLRRLKSGGLGASKRMSSSGSSHERHLLPGEKELLVRLDVISRLYYYTSYQSYRLQGKLGQELLRDLLATNKCILKSTQKTLNPGEAAVLSLEWDVLPSGHQQLVFKTGIENAVYFFVDDLWYFDPTHCRLGPVQTDIPRPVLEKLLKAPAIAATHAPAVNQLIQKQAPLSAIPRLKVALPDGVQSVKPIPCLQLKMQEVFWQEWNYGRQQTFKDNIPVAILTYKYEDQHISWAEAAPVISYSKGDHLVHFARDLDAEHDARKLLEPFALEPIESDRELSPLNEQLRDNFMFKKVSPLEFATRALPELRERGWRITIDPDYAFQVVDIEDDSDNGWFADVVEGETSDWFNLELGISVDGEKVNLLPLLNDFLSQIKDVKEIDDLREKVLFAPLPNGQFAAIPGERVQNIMRSLVELFDHDALDMDQQLRLSKSQAARLLEIEKACGATQLRWHGGERLRELGKKISAFKEIVPAPIPSSFRGELRPYQHEGLSWLQFLREYELGGILADDMGLGKTIQALTHVILEKESGRMTNPSLVIAPTSLMYNWEKESKQFAPDLKVALLHGPDRKQLFESLDTYDLILTTYPLIVRDKEVLLKQPFHLLILDEAQYIKNSKNLATQVALQLKANHRLCLTGTPMENHLGELWSLYHFLMPGLLGDEKTFRRRFRTPIEKHADNDRREVLNRRLAPFLLRRTKEAVVKELPQKTDIVQYVELDGPQRDLYETIRIAMEEKVRKEVEKLGLSRSHIIILDALLKLRQVCCDPRLLKVDSPMKKSAASAKMEWLSDMLPEMIEEGRKILLFSQFTEMLALIEQFLAQAKIPYVKLTGQTKDRKTAIEQFQNGEVPLFLISLKAGGTGLNLTAADTVIHFDPWWNPAVENQATDRAYRIGQDKPVFVYKIVTRGTVEEKIIAMQAKKHALAESIYSDKSTGEAKITEDDLKALFAPL